MRLGLFRVENVNDFNAARFEIIRDERAMTTPPDRFEPGNIRTSATALIPFPCKSERKMSILRVEWPIVQMRGIILGCFAFTKFPVTFQPQLRNENEKITPVSNLRPRYIGAYARRRYANSTRGRHRGARFQSVYQ